jgi:hypothetical protein
LAAQPSRDLIVAAHQQITGEWWGRARGRFELFVSEAVLEGIRRGDQEAATRRLELVAEVPVLSLNEDVMDLALQYEQELGLPSRARVDVLHIAFGVAFEMDYLVTWNCAHIANGEVVRRLREVNATLNRPTPLVVTPEELLEAPGGEKQ